MKRNSYTLRRGIFAKLSASLVMLLALFGLSGVKGCEENYVLVRPQASVSPSPTDGETATPSPTTSFTPTATATRTPTVTITPSSSPTVSPTNTPTVTPTSTTIGDPFSGSPYEEMTSSSSSPTNAGSSTSTTSQGQNEATSNNTTQDDGIDSDFDGLPDVLEDTHLTDKFSPDTDGDGFTDSFEIMRGFNPLDAAETPPNLKGAFFSVNNGNETSSSEPAGSPVPRASEEELFDTDGDGLGDDLEVILGRNPLEFEENTEVDSDGDSITDSLESELGLNTNSADTDLDYLSDTQELLHSQNPRNPDSNGNGLLDGLE